MVARFRTSATRGNGNCFIDFADTTGRKGYVGYAAANDSLLLVNELNNYTAFGNNATVQMILAATGELVLNYGGNLTPAAVPAVNAIGYLGSPQIATATTYTLVMADAGKHYYHTSGSAHTLTIPANASVAFPIGTVIGIVNENGGGVLTLAITTDTLRWGALTGSRSLAANATATLLKVAATVWRLTGDGIT